MRKIPYKTWLLVFISLLAPCLAGAAGLGKLTVLSALGQPLVAEVELVSVSKDELSTLTARVASPEAFRQANIQYSPALVGMRVSIEKRGDGTPYIKVVSTRTLNEPFVDVLLELNWAQGRLVREYTALIDPPGFATAAAPTAVTPVTPPSTVEAKPLVTAPPATSQQAIARPPNRNPASAKDYTVKRGDTLSKIASSMKPDGVTLEQMLVGLYRANPDAFSGNMNRLKSGKILRAPEADQLTATTATEAKKEVRVQAADWNSYRRKLAEVGGETPAQEGKSAASGKITPKVEEKAASAPASKEVLKLSKGESPTAPGKSSTGKPLSAQEQIRVLQEEATAKEKALAEANDRVTQLEKTIKDMQRLMEIKGQAPGATATPAPAPAKSGDASKSDATKSAAAPATTTPAPSKAEPPKAAPTTPDASKSEPPKSATVPDATKAAGTAATATPPGSTPTPGPTPAPSPTAAPSPGVTSPAPATPPATATTPGATPPTTAATTATPPAKAPAKAPPKAKGPPPPPPSLVDQIMDEPLYLAAGGAGIVILLGLGIMAARRRRSSVDLDDRKAPELGKEAHVKTMSMTTPVAAAPAVGGDDVDPLAEADLYLNFGRDTQAEEVLKEALEKNPNNEEALLKLAQIYSGRKDQAAFARVAQSLHRVTKGNGERWLKAAAMGYALDPDNALYAAGQSVSATAAPPPTIPGSTDLDFDLELPDDVAKTSVDFNADAGNKTVVMQPGALADMVANASQADTTIVDITADSGAHRAAASASTVLPDFALDSEPLPRTRNPDITLDDLSDDSMKTHVSVDSAGTPPMIDFNFDAGSPSDDKTKDDKHFTSDGTLIMETETAKASSAVTDVSLNVARSTATTSIPKPLAPDFKFDFGGGDNAGMARTTELKMDDVNLRVGGGAAPAKTDAGTKDDHWYDVQTKFDLAKAYQEMGDKDGAREILQEVLAEGDVGQKSEAKQLLDSIG